jgi:hypothetical protein
VANSNLFHRGSQGTFVYVSRDLAELLYEICLPHTHTIKLYCHYLVGNRLWHSHCYYRTRLALPGFFLFIPLHKFFDNLSISVIQTPRCQVPLIAGGFGDYSSALEDKLPNYLFL